MRRLLSSLREKAGRAGAVSVLALLLSLIALTLAVWAVYRILSTRQDVWLSYSTEAGAGMAPAVLTSIAALSLLAVAYGIRKRRS